MSDCIFCIKPDIICKNTPVWCIGIPVPKTQLYLHYSIIDIIPIQADFSKMTVFTPGARLNLMPDEASTLIAHRKAWFEIMKAQQRYAAIFDNTSDLENNTIAVHLENLKLVKDWDVLKINDTEYVLNKRAAKILYESTLQFHGTLKTLIESHVILKVFDFNGVLIKGSKK